MRRVDEARKIMNSERSLQNVFQNKHIYIFFLLRERRWRERQVEEGARKEEVKGGRECSIGDVWIGT